MFSIRRKERAVFLLVCIIGLGILVSGCNYNLRQQDGEGRSLAKLTLGGEKGLKLSIGEGPCNTGLYTDKTMKEEHHSLKPTFNETDIDRTLVNNGQSQLMVENRLRETQVLSDTNIKQSLIKEGLGEGVLSALNR